MEADGLLALSPYEARLVGAVFERLFPADHLGPGAADIGVPAYLDRALSGPYRGQRETYRLGLQALDSCARQRHGLGFADCSGEQQDALLESLERGTLDGFPGRQEAFFELLRAHLQEGLFADPAHGGNRAKQGWRFLAHPGFWRENSAEENLAAQPVTKGGVIRSLADAGWSLGGHPPPPPDVPGYDPQAGCEVPDGPCDVVLVGVGAMGSLAARLLAERGLRVVGLEAGPWRGLGDYAPDELNSAYYCRGEMGAKFLAETPRWRRREGEETQEAQFSLGRMMNGVGGSVIHWGGALRRCHPHHFRYLTHVRERYGAGALPAGHTLADWPVSYDELEPYYAALEDAIGVAGDGDANPFVPRSRPLPLPPLRPFTGGLLFRQAAEAMGLHPYPTPVAVNSVPYHGFPATTYCAWMGGFGPFDQTRWHPDLTWVPDALAAGFRLRTHCRAMRIMTNRAGQASGVEYVDPSGVLRRQEASAVVLCGYTFENVRLLLLSGDDKHPNGLGNNRGQVGKHFLVKGWGDVYGYFPDVVFNAHTGPAAQMWGLDDYIAADFDSLQHGFIGGVTPNVENQRLPIQISREEVPPGVKRWGAPYKSHLRRWQHVYAVRLQPESLSYQDNYLDLDPRHRDRAGLPLVRVTYDVRENETRQAEWAEGMAEELLRGMGAAQTWRTPRRCRVCSSHDLGGCRMGEDPASSVVDAGLQVHDTPGLYVLGGAVFPTCPGVNPTLTMWALAWRAAERLQL